EDAEASKGALQSALGSQYEVNTWEELFPFVKDLLNTQDVLFNLVTTIFLVVVLLGIVNAMLMSVLERVREIGTMLAVGMRRRQIVSLFVLEGMVLGALGGAIGVAIGFLAVHLMAQVGIDLPAPGSTTASVIHPFISA